jgi:PAS domain S-box-containing protein
LFMDQPVKILVVDDQCAILHATCRILEAAGYTTLAASSGAEALRLVSEQKPDLVLLDVNLPDISGFNICKQIKTNSRLRGIFVVIVSAQHTDSSSQSEALETGADGYMTRPISNRELLAQVQAMLRIHAVEAALRQSEERFRTMTDFTQDWEYWIGPERQFIYISPSCEAVCGYAAREFREDPDMLMKIIHPVDRAALQEHEETFFQSRQLGSLEMRIITRSGEVRWIQHICRPVYGADGRWLGRRASNRDITAHKHSEEALERQNRTLRFLQEIALDIGGELEISALLHNIMQHAVDLARADRGGGIYLYEADKHVLRLVEGAGINQDRVGITVGENEGVAGHVFRTAKPLVIDNYTRWEERADVLVASPPSTVMGLPLLIKGQVIGVLTLIANSMQRTFTEEDMRLAGMFAAKASLAIQNAQLYGKAKEEIDERRRAEEQLKNSEERYRILLENTGTGIVIVDRQGVYQLVNQKAADILGARTEDIIGKSMFDFFPREIAQKYLEENQKVIDSGIGREYEETYLLLTGERTFLVTDRCLKDASGQAVALQSSSIEITHRKQAEEVLRESEERFRLIFENSGDAILLSSPDGKVYKANPAACRMFGRSEEEICQSGRQGLVDASDPRLPVALETQQRTGKFTGELTFLRRDGQPFPVEITSTMFQEGGQIRNSLIIRDISERKQAEEYLKESEQRFRSIIENTAAGYFFVGRDGLWKQVNQAWLQMHGFDSKEEVIGRHFSLTQVNMDLEQANKNVKGLLGGQTIATGEASRRYKDGSIGFHSFSANPVVQRGEIVGLEGFIIDTTKHKRAEEALQKSHERLRALTFRLAQAEESQRRSMARELHDRVGQNLTALNANLNTIRSQLTPEGSEKVAAWLDDSTQLVEEMMKHVSDVIAVLRPPLLEDYGLLAALRQYAEQIVRHTGLKVEVLESGKPFPRPSLDVETTLFRLAQEALNNVARHAGASQVTLRLEADSQIIRLFVTDDGHGFDLAEVARDEKISGWGLISMRERIESIGGSLQLLSEPGKGTRIIVEIPDLSRAAAPGRQASGE